MFPIDFENVCQVMTEAVVIADADGQLLWVNRRMAALIGKPERIITSWDYRRAPIRNYRPDMSPMPVEELAGFRARVELQSVQDVLVGILPVGSSDVRWMLSSAVPIFDKGGILVGTVSVLTDITQRKKRREQLEEANQKYQTLMGAIRSLINQQPLLEPDERLAMLTRRQIEVLEQVARGLDNREIADLLGLAESSVRRYVSEIKATLELKNRVEMALFARRNQLVDPYEDSN